MKLNSRPFLNLAIPCSIFAFAFCTIDVDLSFSDITNTIGVGGPSGANAGGHGAMWADITEDGLPDLYMPFNWKDQEYPDYFYRNRGTSSLWAEESSSRGIRDKDGGSHGACWADMDNDGDYDLVNGSTESYGSNDIQNDVYRNDGRGYFTEMKPSVIENRKEHTRGMICFDMDQDGDLDIFCVSGWMGSGDPSDERNEVYRNDGNFSFTTFTSGALYTCPAGQGCVDTDWDGDGDIDVIACNKDGDLNILRNNGGFNNFTLVSPSSIGINHRAYAGVTTGDIDNDGDLDMILCNNVGSGVSEGYLYSNNCNGTFSHIRTFQNTDGYMAGLADLDNDGDLDLVFPGRSAVYLNNGNGSFSDGPSVPNTSGLVDPRAVSFADIDNDGDLDFIYAGKKVPNKLYRNNSTENKHLKVK